MYEFSDTKCYLHTTCLPLQVYDWQRQWTPDVITKELVSIDTNGMAMLHSATGDASGICPSVSLYDYNFKSPAFPNVSLTKASNRNKGSSYKNIIMRLYTTDKYPEMVSVSGCVTEFSGFLIGITRYCLKPYELLFLIIFISSSRMISSNSSWTLDCNIRCEF